VRKLKIFLLLGVLPLTLPWVMSCTTPTNTEFTVASSAKTLILLDTTTRSCQALNTAVTTDDVTSVYFTLPTLTFTWTRPETLTVHWVNFTLRSGAISNNAFSFTMGGDQLLYTFYNASTAGVTSVTLPNSVASTGPSGASLTNWVNTCAYKVGGISIIDKSKDGYGTATITVYATYQDSNNDTVPLTTRVFTDFFFKGTGL
jgi:hypothetical protein